MSFETIGAILSLLGMGGLVGTYLRIQWERRNQAQLHKQEFKETRYKCMILLMYTRMDFDKHAPLLHQHGRAFASTDELIDELITEWHNMILFASEDVLAGVHRFVNAPTTENFRKAAFAMRADLWGGKVSDEILAMSFQNYNVR